MVCIRFFRFGKCIRFPNKENKHVWPALKIWNSSFQMRLLHTKTRHMYHHIHWKTSFQYTCFTCAQCVKQKPRKKKNECVCVCVHSRNPDFISQIQKQNLLNEICVRDSCIQWPLVQIGYTDGLGCTSDYKESIWNKIPDMVIVHFDCKLKDIDYYYVTELQWLFIVLKYQKRISPE